MLLRRRKSKPSDGEHRWLAVGLGNPGTRFANTRHNAGGRAAELLARDLDSKLKPSRLRALVARGTSNGQTILVARPATYYNESGIAVASLLAKFEVALDHVIVIHDDIDLKFGMLRLKFGGGSGGNHGIESIESSVKSQDFFRVRIGVGRPISPNQDPADFVLDQMTKNLAGELAVAEAEAADAALAIIVDGLERAMNRFNSR